MKSSSKNSNGIVVSLLVASMLLLMSSSGSLLAEATIPNFSAIRENLVHLSSARRSMRGDVSGRGSKNPPPTPAARPGQNG